MTLVPDPIASQEAHGATATRFQLAWWSQAYPYRRKVIVSAPPGVSLPPGHPVTALLPVATQQQGKLRHDYEDLEVVLFQPEGWTRLPRSVVLTDDVLEVRFLQPGPDIDLYLYYGNPSASGLGRPLLEENPWPIQASDGDPALSFVRPEEYWKAGVSSVRNAQVTLAFVGTAARILSDRGPAAGIAELQLDDEPWLPVDLFAPAPEPEVEIYRREGLAGTSHKMRLRATGRRSPTSRGTSVNFVRFEYLMPSDVSVGAEETVALAWGGSSYGT